MAYQHVGDHIVVLLFVRPTKDNRRIGALGQVGHSGEGWEGPQAKLFRQRLVFVIVEIDSFCTVLL